MKSIPPDIMAALSKPIDYSNEFTQSVEMLKNSLSQDLNLQVKHDSGMDYSPAQFISFLIVNADDNLSRKRRLSRNKSSFEARYYISSRAPLFATYIIDSRRSLVSEGEINHPIEIFRLPPSVQNVVNFGREFLQKKGYVEVEYDLFRENAPDCLTQLDGLPATIFETLFTEIV
jgi:hypothetical protein